MKVSIAIQNSPCTDNNGEAGGPSTYVTCRGVAKQDTSMMRVSVFPLSGRRWCWRGEIRGLISPNITAGETFRAQPATLIGVWAQRSIRDGSYSWTACLQRECLRGSTVVLQSSGIEYGIGGLLVSGHATETTGTTFQVESQMAYRAFTIIPPELR